jgi:hypothetical protein
METNHRDRGDDARRSLAQRLAATALGRIVGDCISQLLDHLEL